MPPVDPEERSAPRAFWSGTISFGLVSIPVDLFPGTRNARASLRLLDSDGTPLARRYYCPAHEREVRSDEIARGYQLESGAYVVVTDEELEALEPRKSRDIDLRRFVPREQLDPIQFERGYFLAPSAESTKAYRLLALVMERSGRAGIATFVMRGKEYLVAILAEEGILRAETLRFQDEVRSAEDVGLPQPERVSRREVRRFQSAIDRLLSEDIEPEDFVDEYTRRLVELAEKKRARRRDVVRVPDAEPPEAEVVDLMEVLRQSLRGRARGESRSRRPPKAASGPRPRKREERSLRDLSRDELYQRAREVDVPGRSQMTKDQLARALRARGT